MNIALNNIEVMKIECYPGNCILLDFVNIEDDRNILIYDDLIEDKCVLQCSSHSSDQSMGQKTGDKKSRSLPENFNNALVEKGNLSAYDGYQNISCHCSTPYLSSDSWFKTWPEKCDKSRSKSMSPCNSCDKSQSKNTHVIQTERNLSLDEAIEELSLTHNCPKTIVPQPFGTSNLDSTILRKDFNQNEQILAENEASELKKLSDIQRSDPVPQNQQSHPTNLSQTDQKQCDFEINSECTSKRKLTNFLNRNVLLRWKQTDVPSSIGNFFKFLGTNSHHTSSFSHQNVASSSALIQYSRPPNVPAKSLEEEEKHREEYKAILAAAKRKEAMNSAIKKKLEQKQLLQEEGMANAAKYFIQKVLPNWESMKDNKKTRELWWQGIPSNVRGKVWSLAIGNELNLTVELYEICLARAQERLNEPKIKRNEANSNQEQSLDAIKLDISRTFPHLCIFQEGGPYSGILHSLLAAYVCYRPDVGYVQGMSYIAAILILNMDPNSAFICFANLLNQPLHLSAFTLNQNQMFAYFEAFHEVFNYNLPKLCLHFEKSGLTPDLYLLDWIYTIFAKAMPLDVACRIWDVFLRDGYEFIFRTALGILSLHQEKLIKMDFLDGAQFLTRLPDNISSDNLFKSIQNISVNIGKTTFSQIVERRISKCSNES